MNRLADLVGGVLILAGFCGVTTILNPSHQQQAPQQPAAQPQPQGQPQPPQTQKVPGLEITVDRQAGQSESAPAFQFDPSERFVNVRARAEQGSDLQRVEWVVLSTGKVPPKINEGLNDQNSVITVGLPDPHDSLYISANALINVGGKPKITPHAAVTVTVSDGSTVPSPMAAGQNVQPAAIPAFARLSVIVVGQTKADAEIAQLAASQAVRSALAQSGSTLYVMGLAEAQARPRDVLPHVRAVGALPCILVVTQDGRRLLPDGKAQKLSLLRFDGRNDAEIGIRNERILLDTIGRAAGGR